MAKLPRSPISQGVSNEYRPVRQARASGNDPVGAALTQAGNAGFEIANRMAEAKIAADATEASIRLRSRLDEASREIENDMEGDPAAFEGRFRERAAAIVNEESERMSSPALKKAFGLKSQEMTEAYSLGMRDVTRRRQVEGVKAQALKIGTDYELLAQDPSKPRELLTQAHEDYRSMIDRQVRAGIYTPDQAEELRIRADATLRAGVSERHLSTVDTLINQGRAEEAEAYFFDKANFAEIDPAQRERAEAVLQSKTLEAKAIAKADAFWAGANGDYGGAIAEAAKIKNPDERLAVESRIAQLKVQGEAAKEAVDRAHLEKGMDFVTRGEAIPSDLLRQASPLVRDRLQTEVRTRRLWDQQMATLSAEEKAAMKQASNVSKDYFKSLAAVDPELYLGGPATWTPEVLADWDRLQPEHKSDVLSDIAMKRAAGGTFDAASAVLRDVIAQVPMLGPSNMKARDVDGTSKSTGAALKEEQAVRASLYRQAQEYAKRTGGAAVTPQDSKLMIARAFREANATRYPFEEPGAFTGRISTAVDRNLPYYRDTVEYLREKLGRDPTDEEMLTTMRALEGAE